MFVRWKTRLRTARWNRGEPVHTAVLVESQRVPVGDGSRKAPRLKVICYLGSIREKQNGCYYHNKDFWASATQAMDRIGLPSEERSKIVDVLLAKVPKPTTEMLKRDIAEVRKILTKRPM